ncbi:CLUMA_CG014365, isoform A [Clunio marinus]|uniref:Glycerate kinase n=1 Tax=Clunio marinus TaxID=568069 RepID=A0A1J1ILU4_9DIPT|nr:CLUMA_CG014365, isoform A [Clunio marinus]
MLFKHKFLKRFSLFYRCVNRKSEVNMEETLKRIFNKSVDSVKPVELISKNKFVNLIHAGNKCLIEINDSKSLNKYDVTKKKIHVVGFGKGVLALALELECVLEEKLISGILSVPIGASKMISLKENSNIKIIEGAVDNLPDEKSLNAAKEIKEKVQSLTDDDILFVLITGGGSALLPLPIEPISLNEKSTLIKNLSRAGATINEINTVRIAISQVKGGKLLQTAKKTHKIISLIISDIVDDPLDLIASSPTIPYKKPINTPKEILEKYNLFNSLPKSILKIIEKNGNIQQDLSSEPIVNSDVFLIGNNRIAIEAAMKEAKHFNLFPVFLSSAVQGNVADVSQAFFELAVTVQHFSSLSQKEFQERIAKISLILSPHSNFFNDLVAALKADLPGICIISGGETTVTVTGDGLGGRNQELTLRFTRLCHDANTQSLNDLLLLSAGTDGVDGNNDAAGALGGSRILSDFIKDDMKSETNITRVLNDFISRNDSYNFYKNFLKNHGGDRYQIIIGHTGTNVMDVHLLMIMTSQMEKLS